MPGPWVSGVGMVSMEEKESDELPALLWPETPGFTSLPLLLLLLLWESREELYGWCEVEWWSPEPELGGGGSEGGAKDGGGIEFIEGLCGIANGENCSISDRFCFFFLQQIVRVVCSFSLYNMHDALGAHFYLIII